MDPAGPRAVLLCYASQDVEGARSIDDALRAFEMEGWSDPRDQVSDRSVPDSRKIHLALHRGWIVFAFPAFLAGQTPVLPPVEASDSTALVKLEPVEVTGSRIKRVDYETPSPVVTYTAEAIEEKGYATLGDFIQSLSFNNGQINTELTIGSFVTGAATSNPRGLGSHRFLTLVNGRRAVPYGLTDGIWGTPTSVFNFNSIPSAAIDHFEFLKDGASAIYGSDAITGVYNIILKRNYTGAVLDFSLSNTPRHDSLFGRANLSAGFAKDGWQVFGTVGHQVRHSNYIQDFGTHSSNYSYLGPKGTNKFSFINQPSYVFLRATQAAAAGVGAAGYYVIPGSIPTANPTKANFVNVGTSTAGIPAANRYDFAAETAMQPASEQTSGYVSLERKFTLNLSAFAQMAITRSKTYYDFGPFGYESGLSGLTLAANNPYNPFGIPLTVGAAAPFAFTLQTGSTHQRREASDTASSFLAGLRGKALKTWEWESAVNYGVDHTLRLTDYLSASALRDALAGTTRETAVNPFGASDNPNVLASLLARVPERDNIVDAFSYDVSVNGKLWQIPLRSAGELGVATGYEYRLESLRGHPDEGSYIGFTANLPFHGRRHVNAAYLELAVPLQKWFELQVAARHERYSDFGHTTKPKYSAKLNLPKNRFVHVLLRGSYSESFKAPDLGQTYQRQAAAHPNISDPLRPQDGVRSVLEILGGNPALKPEEGKVQFLGFVFEVPAVKGLSFTADYIDIKIRNVIFPLSLAYLLTPEGLQQFPHAVVRNNTLGYPGPIISFYGIAENLGFQLFRGWDYGARYTLRTGHFGVFNFNADVSQLIKRGADAGLGGGFVNNTGRWNAPVWRSNLGVNWRYKQVGVAVTGDVIGKLYNRTYTAVGWGENIFPVINTTIRYHGFKRTTLSLGASNVLNHRPPPNGYTNYGYDEKAITAIGAQGIVLSFRLRREL